ncbi:MAG: CU044_2847 family protein [Crocosphaera sp.]|nr:CU044_2847 family protein [Crocosphaera sp.]
MATNLIQLEDGALVEVEVPEEKAREIAGGYADRVNSTFEQIKPLLTKICRPIKETWEEINKEMTIDQVEVEIGLAFELEGNLYITKSKVESNLTVKLILNSATQSDTLTK